MGDQRLPVLRRGGRCRRRGELEVRPGAVVQHQEHVLAADHGVLEVVLEAVAALGEDLPAGALVSGVEEAVLGGRLRPRRDHQVPVGAAAAHADPEATVGLVEHQLVVGLVGADPVPPHLVGAPGVVDGRVVEVAAVGAPRDATEHARDHVGEEVAGGEVLDPHGVPLVAVGVGRVGEEPVVEAHRRGTHGEELVSLGELVEVQQELLAGQRRLVRRGVLGRLRRRPAIGLGHRDPAARAVLLALEGAGVVPVTPAPGRDREVRLQGAGLDLLEDGRAQVGQVSRALLGVGVLGLEVARDLRVVLDPQPVVGVDPFPAVVRGGDRSRGGDGRRGGVGHAATLAGRQRAAP